MNLALFDFDGTITNKDSMFDFIHFAVGGVNFYCGLALLSPMLLAFKLKLLSNQSAKQTLLSYYFKDWNESLFKQVATNYSLTRIDLIIRPEALTKIKWHQQNGDAIVIVSASIECWLKAWCVKHHLGLIATRLEIKDQKLTGAFSTKNCFAAEKVNRINQQFDLDRYDTIYAYGDSSGDLEMLDLADEKFYRAFTS